jgi:hypothetical protein
VAAIEQRLGEGVVVRSDDIEGNEVGGSAWPSGGGQEHRFTVRFTDDGHVVDCTVEAAAGD